MNNLKYFGIIFTLFWALPLYGIRDPFSFDTTISPNKPIVNTIIDCNVQQSLQENVSSEKKELAIGDTIHACKVVSISERELTLQNKEGCLHKIQLPQEKVEEN